MLLFLLRLPFLLAQLLVGLPVVIFFLSPPVRRLQIRGARIDQHVIRLWSASLCRVFGLDIHHQGRLSRTPVLLVANHISWLDIEIIHTRVAAGFVAKEEIRRWPLIGWLAARAGTVFHKRGCNSSADRVVEGMAERLRSGGYVAIFPEGGAHCGSHVRTFHARLLRPAFEEGIEVQPVAIRFSRNGQRISEPAFRPNEHFVGNLLRLLAAPPTRVDIRFGAPLSTRGTTRKRVANLARQQVAEFVDGV